jgi:tRNA(fMet)-specific endonuclease VapC
VRFLLDTDTCIFALQHHLGVRFHFEAVTPAQVAISALNEAELWQGALSSRHPAQHAKDVQAFLAPLLVLPFDGEAAREHARLRMALKLAPLDERDLVIASVALVHRLTVVTHNLGAFTRVPGLKTVDWSSTA